METAELPLNKQVRDLLDAQRPLRVATFLRNRSPYSDLPWGSVVDRACTSLGVCPTLSRAKLLTIWETRRMTIFAFDLWNTEYDWATAHHRVDLPVILVDYGRNISLVKVGSRDFRDKVNTFVASQHELNGWYMSPPYFQDSNGSTAVMHRYPRSLTSRLTLERIAPTPPSSPPA